jgi:predicted alpha/beta-fold hydrolase
MRYLLKHLREKVTVKDRMFPGALDLSNLNRINTFQEFDDRFTAPLHGFRDAVDYWRKSSCKQFLKAVGRPACIINARNDPFLGPACFPEEEARHNRNLTLITPDTGGHVGFVSRGGEYWSEWTAMRFLQENM